MLARTVSPGEGVDCDILIRWGGERNTLYKGMKPFPNRHVLKTLPKNPKKTISTSAGSRPL